MIYIIRNKYRLARPYILLPVEYLSFIDPERREFGEIFPEVMIFPEGFSPREISSLKEIFRRIPRAEGL